jgi:LAO/AO transport system kinase
MAPGQGDDVQAIKAGILECADVFAVNKADRDGADATVRDLELMIALGSDVLGAAAAKTRGHTAVSVGVPRQAPAAEGWTPPIVKTVAPRNEGVAAVVQHLREHKAWLDGTPAGSARRAIRLREQMFGFLRDALAEEALSALGSEIGEAARRVEAREIDPYSACDALIERFRAR